MWEGPAGFPGGAQARAQPHPAHGVSYRLQPVVQVLVHALDALANGIGHSPRCAPDDPGGDSHAGGGIVPDTRINPLQRSEEGAVFRERHWRDAAGTMVSLHGDCDAGAGMLVVPRPGIGRIGVEQRPDLIQQRGISAFPRIDCVQVGRNEPGAHRVDLRPAGDRIRAIAQGSQIDRHPVRCDASVGVGGQQGPTGSGQSGGAVHGDPPRLAGTGARRGKLDIQRVNGKRQVAGDAAEDKGGVVRAVVQADDERID